jgi:adenylate cyclase
VNEPPHKFWRIGDWRVCPTLGEISRNGNAKKLDPRTMRLLMFLAERPGRVVGVRELLEGVWGRSVVTPHSVYEAIASLRQSLEDPSDRPVYIATLPRRGYRLIAPVEPSPSAVDDRVLDAAGPDGASKDQLLAPTALPTPTAPQAPAVPSAPIAARVPSAPSEMAPPHPLTRRFGIAVAAVAIVLGTILTVAWFTGSLHTPPRSTPADKSIAVLPFLDLSEDKNQEYFADGLAEELLEVLVNVPGLRVVGRTSSFQFKNKNDDVRTIGTKLGAAYVVEGSVRRAGNHVRVAVQLIRASDGIHQLSATYDRHVDDVLQLESELATAIGRALQLAVSNGGTSSRFETTNAEAIDHYLQGLHALDTYTQSGSEEAVHRFQAAIALDQKFTAAYVRLGMAHYVQAAFGFMPPDTAFPRAREDALNALKLNSQSAVAHALLARVATLYSWDWPEAQREAATALALGSQNSFALYTAADLASVLGDSERSERLFRASLVSDPLNPETHFMLALALSGLGRLEEAEIEARRCLAISPTYVFGHSLLAGFLTDKGQEESIAECKREVPEGGQATCLANAYYALDRMKESDASLQEAIRSHGSDQAFLIALTYAQRGEADNAFEWLDRAYRQRDPILQYLKAATELSKLKDDPRYEALLRKMRLPL